MLTKQEIAEEIEARTGVKPTLVKNILNTLAEIAADEVASGQDFTVPGIAKVSYRYRSPAKKGEKYKKGETVVGFGGVERVAEEDSPVVKAKIALRATVTGIVGRERPKTSPEAQSAFLKSKAGKAVVARSRG